MEWKRQQVENLAFFLNAVLEHPRYSADKVDRPLKIVDFCGGSGYVALPLACRWPQHRFVILDLKQRSLDIAAERVRSAGLTNVSIQNGLVQDFAGHFDVGIALHACGEATDYVLDRCVAQSAAYILAPCCVGKVNVTVSKFAQQQHGPDGQQAAPAPLQRPRSAAIRAVVTAEEYRALAKAADYASGHGDNQGASGVKNRAVQTAAKTSTTTGALGVQGGRAQVFRKEVGEIKAVGEIKEAGEQLEAGIATVDIGAKSIVPLPLAPLAGYSQRELRRRLSKSYVEHDRNLFAEETGNYITRLFVLHPPSCSPKNDVLVGIPPTEPLVGGDLGWFAGCPTESVSGTSAENNGAIMFSAELSAERAVLELGLAF
jgi:hypothetical protein